MSGRGQRPQLALGAHAGALDHALAYARERKQFGKPIGDFQGVQFELAEMAVDVEAARLLVYNAARLKDAGKPYVTEAAMAKYFASRDRINHCHYRNVKLTKPNEKYVEVWNDEGDDDN